MWRHSRTETEGASAILLKRNTYYDLNSNFKTNGSVEELATSQMAKNIEERKNSKTTMWTQNSTRQKNKQMVMFTSQITTRCDLNVFRKFLSDAWSSSAANRLNCSNW